MPPAGLQPTIQVSVWPQTYALDRAATETLLMSLHVITFISVRNETQTVISDSKPLTPPPHTHTYNSCKQRAMWLPFLELILTPGVYALVLIQSFRRLKFLSKLTRVTNACTKQRYTVVMTAYFY